LAAEGKGIIVVSSDLPELLGICHRIVIFSNGKITGDDFTFNVDFNGMSIPHKGKITGDTVTIKAEGDMAMEFTLKRAAK